MYHKEIIYMSLVENEVKNACVGYMKVERTGENYSVEVSVKNVAGISEGNFPLRFQEKNDWKETDITFNDSCAKWRGTIAGPVMKAEILLSPSVVIRGMSKDHKDQPQQSIINSQEESYADNLAPETQLGYKIDPDKSAYPEAEKELSVAEKTMQKSTVQQSEEQQTSKRQLEEQRTSKQQLEEQQTSKQQLEEQQTSIQQLEERQSLERQAVAPQLYEDKWEQLLAAYENIHPYGDDRVYIKLEPKDFVILRSDYQHLVNNSFLLHGFYNYRYLILGKEKSFYIGVPGVFYEREKMVALMFGFEAFECEGGDAEEGKFGYYLRKVEI